VDCFLGFRNVQSDRVVAVEAPSRDVGFEMMETNALTACTTDFEQMTTQMRQRLRPTPALALADWLRVYLGLSGGTDELRKDFPPHDDIARLVRLGPSDLKRQLSSVLSAILSEESQPREIQGAIIAANIA
jgi:hypothetical protein